MKIILKQDVANLGHKNDVLTVKDGYARNFLIPKKMALELFKPLIIVSAGMLDGGSSCYITSIFLGLSRR